MKRLESNRRKKKTFSNRVKRLSLQKSRDKNSKRQKKISPTNNESKSSGKPKKSKNWNVSRDITKFKNVVNGNTRKDETETDLRRNNVSGTSPKRSQKQKKIEKKLLAMLKRRPRLGERNWSVNKPSDALSTKLNEESARSVTRRNENRKN